MRVLRPLFALIAIAFYLLTPTVVVFAATPPPTCQLHLNTTQISIGGSVTLSWTSTNATGGAITNVGNVGPSGSINLLPSSNAYTTYLGSFTGPGGTANCSVTVSVSAGGGGNVTDTSTTGTTNSTVAPATSQTNTTIPSNPLSQLVPCGYGTFNSGDTSNTPTDASSTGCQACSLAQLVQNIITFLIGLSIPVAAALFAWAGVLYFTSAENVSQRQRAKDIFKNVLIGFVIAITAWLVINTFLNVLFSQNSALAGSNWFQIQCSATTRPIATSVSDVLNSILGNGTVANSGVSTGGTQSGGSAGTSVYSCSAGSTLEGTGDQAFCITANGTIVNPNCASGYTQLGDGSCMNNLTGNTANVGDVSTISQSCPSGSTLNPTDSGGGTCISDTTGQVVTTTQTSGNTGGGSASSLLQAVYAQETGSGAVGANVCNAYDACGPMQIQPGTACNAAAGAGISVPGCSGGSMVDQSQVENYLNTAGFSQPSFLQDRYSLVILTVAIATGALRALWQSIMEELRRSCRVPIVPDSKHINARLTAVINKRALMSALFVPKRLVDAHL